MTTVFTIASGKGGTGKTTVTANLGSMLAYHKKRTYILDSDMGMANLGLVLGLENMPVTLHEVLAGKADIHEAIYEGPFGVSVIPSGLSLEGFKNADPGKLSGVLKEITDECDILIIDAPAGINHDGIVPLAVADEVILVVNPDISSLVDALKTKMLTEMLGGKVRGAIINRISSVKDTKTRNQIEKMLSVPVIGIIPEDVNVRRASACRSPIVVKYPTSDASRAFRRISATLIGIDYKEDEDTKTKKKEKFIERFARALFPGGKNVS
ncbi:septum site-determining protein MinD [Methanomicrobium sp. W14]|uniref:cell division ATPase MinD n=1 Tax=Methanomicrobium sp. W14 TaxID=2817839 RepID=UPI001AE91DFF|nr:cell division ATPase MinD [Methanomicrobium sp. W14]MBP2134484.1 septum site-determining protein MinD [Methanomicrobium sp. W14]